MSSEVLRQADKLESFFKMHDFKKKMSRRYESSEPEEGGGVGQFFFVN